MGSDSGARCIAGRHSREHPLAIAAALGVAIASGLLLRRIARARRSQAVAVSQPRQPAAGRDVPLEQLVAQSRELDAILQHLPERPAVERVAMAATIDTIEQRFNGWMRSFRTRRTAA